MRLCWSSLVIEKLVILAESLTAFPLCFSTAVFLVLSVHGVFFHEILRWVIYSYYSSVYCHYPGDIIPINVEYCNSSSSVAKR